MAIWSAFSYIIGLGDRHCDNILLKKNTGDILHIDFDCIFEKGKYLPVPETIPFRLTRNIEAPMGAFKAYGLYRFYFLKVCEFFQKNEENILGALDSFINDPLLENVNNKKVEKDHTNPQKQFEIVRSKIKFSDYDSILEGIDDLIQCSKVKYFFYQ